MKPIKITKTQTPVLIKLAILFVFLIASISFVLSLKYSGENKLEYPILKLDIQLQAPKCSHIGGFFTEAFSISLIPFPNSEIYYTLDGTEPSFKSIHYSKPIIIQNRTEAPNVLSMIPTSPRWSPPIGNVFKGTVLRAICVTEDNQKSTELIRTFFVDEKGGNRYSFPVISLTVDPDDLFGYKNGIYVMGKQYEDKDHYIKKNLPTNLMWWEYPSNYLKRGENSERAIHLEFYEPRGKLGFETEAGVRINGNATRGFGQKSLRICFQKKYGTEQLKYPIFGNNPVGVFNTLLLRNSGNDWDKTMFRDAFMQSLMESYLDVQSYRPCILFINGEYWGIHNIRERSDEDYLANKYKMSKDSIVILEHGGSLFYGKKNDDTEFSNLLNFVKTNDLSQTANYEQMKNKIDLLSFMDFIIANVYFCNGDWPNNNVKFWRYKNGKSGIDSVGVRDGRWRWMLYDTDWGFGYTGQDAFKINLLEKAKKTGSIGIIFDGLLKNRIFREEFKKRFQYHLDLSFNCEKVSSKIDQFQVNLEPEIEEHMNRWRAIGSLERWRANIQDLKYFSIARHAIQMKQLNEFLAKYK